MESGRTFSGREAREWGWWIAHSARRAKIELRSFLDELERSPRVPERTRDESGYADERRAFAQSCSSHSQPPRNPPTSTSCSPAGLLHHWKRSRCEPSSPAKRNQPKWKYTHPQFAGPHDMQEPVTVETPKLPPARDRVVPINERLKPLYPEFEGLNYENRFQLIIAVILSAQCTDARVNKVTPALFARFPTAADIATCDIKELEQLVKSTGFYKNKAKNIRAAASKW